MSMKVIFKDEIQTIYEMLKDEAHLINLEEIEEELGLFLNQIDGSQDEKYSYIYFSKFRSLGELKRYKEGIKKKANKGLERWIS